MKKQLTALKRFLALLMAILMVLMALCATAEDDIELEVSFDEAANGATEVIAVEDEGGIIIDDEDGAIPEDEVLLFDDLDLDGLELSGTLADELIVDEVVQSVTTRTDTLDIFVPKGDLDDFEIVNGSVLKKYRGPGGFVVIPNCITQIGDYAFENCSNLTGITILNGVKSIGKFVFVGCALDCVTIPATVFNIDQQAFSGCENLKDINVYGDNQYYASVDGIMYSKDMKTLICCPEGKTFVDISNTVTAIGDSAFNGCKRMSSVLMPDKATVVAGATLALETKLSPADATTTLTWTSSNKKVASVDGSGLVKALKKGKANITVKTANGKTATCKITVPDAPKKVKFTKKNYSVKVGKTVKLSAKLTPAKAKTILTWSSSDSSIATVSNKGVVKGLKPGKAKITVKTANGKKATVTITVKKK